MIRSDAGSEAAVRAAVLDLPTSVHDAIAARLSADPLVAVRGGSVVVRLATVSAGRLAPQQNADSSTVITNHHALAPQAGAANVFEALLEAGDANHAVHAAAGAAAGQSGASSPDSSGRGGHSTPRAAAAAAASASGRTTSDAKSAHCYLAKTMENVRNRRPVSRPVSRSSC